MKFITEDDLRDLYKKEPFTEYVIEPGTRITPGARQFLADRGINMFDDDVSWKSKSTEKEKQASPDSERKKELCDKRLLCRIKSMEAMFLAAVEDLLNRDVLLAQKLIALKKCFADIKLVLDGKNVSDQLICQNCTVINQDNFSESLDDCFEITEFHIQLGKGKELIGLHRLRCALREMELDFIEFFENWDGENTQREEVIGKVNQIINTLSQLICIAAGGEKCQRNC